MILPGGSSNIEVEAWRLREHERIFGRSTDASP